MSISWDRQMVRNLIGQINLHTSHVDLLLGTDTHIYIEYIQEHYIPSCIVPGPPYITIHLLVLSSHDLRTRLHENRGKRWSFAMAMYNLYYANLSSQLWQTGSTEHILATICFLRLCIFIKIGKKAGVCHIRQSMNFLVWYANSIRVLGITKCETSRHIFSRCHGHR